MKIAISAEKNNIESEVSEVFGRCRYFIVAEIEGGNIKQTEAIENENIKKAGGAGVAAVQVIVAKDVEAVIAENIGPRAMDVLRQFNIKAYAGKGIVKDVLQDYIEGNLKLIQ